MIKLNKIDSSIEGMDNADMSQKIEQNDDTSKERNLIYRRIFDNLISILIVFGLFYLLEIMVKYLANHYSHNI